MSGFLAGIASLGASLLAGGTFEKALLVVLVVAVLVAVVLLAWLLCKLFIVLGRSLLQGAAGVVPRVRERRARRRAERDDALPRVRTGWSENERRSLRRAVREAARIGGGSAPWAVVVCGEGAAGIERELGMTSAPRAEIRVSASHRLVLVDAANASERALRHLARNLRWRRPFDAIVVLAPDGAVAARAAHRAALVARGGGFRAALHVVLRDSGEKGGGAARIVEPGPGPARDLLHDLEADVARGWLAGEGRDAIRSVAGTLRNEVEEAVRALRDRAPACLDLAAVAVGGGRLPETIEATVGRTVPDRRGPLSMQAALALLVAGLFLGMVGALTAVRDAERLGSLMEVVEGQRIERLARADLVPDPARTNAVARLAAGLSEAGGSTWTRPTGRWLPGTSALRELAADLLVGYVGLPLGEEIARRSADLLAPAMDIQTWTRRAGRADRLLGDWDALLSDAREADVAGLLAAAFGEPAGGWPAGVGTVLEETGATRTLERLDVVDGARLREATRGGLLGTAREAGRSRYLEGSVLSQARRAADAAASVTERHASLRRTRDALEQPSAAWLVAPEDRPEHAEILPALARALGLPIVEAEWVARAEADLSRARRQARTDALRIAGPRLGTVLERGGSEAKLRLSSAARAWLEVLDGIEAARLGPPPSDFADLPDAIGPVTLDTARVRRARARIERYEAVAAGVPPALPRALAAASLAHAREQLAAGLARDIEGVLVPLSAPEVHGMPPPPDRNLVQAIETTRKVAVRLADHGRTEAGAQARAAVDRAVESHLRVAMNAVAAADPIRITFGRGGSDPERSRDRLARSIEATRALHRSYAGPLLPFAVDARGEAVRSWRALARALDAWERGDMRSGIGGLASLLDAWAADPSGTCAAPMFPPAPSGYVGQVLRRTRSELDVACRRLARNRLLAARDGVLASFGGALARSWPYSGDPASPDAPKEAVDRYVTALAAAPDLSALDARYVPELERERALWMMDDAGAACIGLGIEWRARPHEDENAHHLIAIEIEGTKQRDGLHRWRYGTPVALRLRLARNSPYRFASGAEGASREHVERFDGSAALLRLLDSLSARGWRISAPLVDEAGREAELRLSVRVFGESGAPLELPAFASLGRGLVGRRA